MLYVNWNIINNSRHQKLIGLKNGSAVTFESRVPTLEQKTSHKLHIPNRVDMHVHLIELKSVIKD